MLSFVLGALVVSLVHALMPDHWMPIVLISRTERWTDRETLWASILIVVPHMLSTIALGVLVGLVGFKLSEVYDMVMSIVAPVVFVSVGLGYIYLNFRRGHHHGHGEGSPDELADQPKGRIISLLAVALFFSPCVPMGSYFFIAGSSGVYSLIYISATYVLVTVASILLLVYAGRKGVELLRWEFLEENERLVTGLVLLVLGILIYFIEI
jgi:nickel/cobalt exporter